MERLGRLLGVLLLATLALPWVHDERGHRLGVLGLLPGRDGSTGSWLWPLAAVAVAGTAALALARRPATNVAVAVALTDVAVAFALEALGRRADVGLVAAGVVAVVVAVVHLTGTAQGFYGVVLAALVIVTGGLWWFDGPDIDATTASASTIEEAGAVADAVVLGDRGRGRRRGRVPVVAPPGPGPGDR
jgi:hypothetical protein